MRERERERTETDTETERVGERKKIEQKQNFKRKKTG